MLDSQGPTSLSAPAGEGVTKFFFPVGDFSFNGKAKAERPQGDANGVISTVDNKRH